MLLPAAEVGSKQDKTLVWGGVALMCFTFEIDSNRLKESIIFCLLFTMSSSSHDESAQRKRNGLLLEEAKKCKIFCDFICKLFNHCETTVAAEMVT